MSNPSLKFCSQAKVEVAKFETRRNAALKKVTKPKKAPAKKVKKTPEQKAALRMKPTLKKVTAVPAKKAPAKK